MRHAKSSWNHSGLTDHQRPLNQRGLRDAQRMGDLLNSEDLIPEIILSSTAERAKLTIRELLKTCHFDGPLYYFDELYEADIDDYIKCIHTLSANAQLVMMVGHNPEISSFLETICDSYEHMPTAAIAWVQFRCEKWTDIPGTTGGKLVKLWTPKRLPH